MHDALTTAGASEPAASAATSPAGTSSRWNRRRAVQTGLCLVSSAALLGSCSLAGLLTPEPEQSAAERASQTVPRAAEPLPQIAALAVGDGRARRPDQPVLVEATSGRLDAVSVTDSRGRQVRGELAPDGRRWSTTAPLDYSTAYLVRARAVNGAGAAAERMARFTTLRPQRTVSVADVTPDTAAADAPPTYGVGMPVVVRFSAPVRRREAVTRALRVQASQPVVGAWRWVADDEVHFRPRQYWPAYTTVDVHLGLRGVEVSPGSWGREDRRLSFRIGAATVSRVDAASLRMQVVRDGKLARDIPVTTGSSRSRNYTTRSGIKVISERNRVEMMESPGFRPGHPEYYRLRVSYALRITDSGEFVHAAPWSRRAHGRLRVSHGCIGMSTVNAKWFYDTAQIGDVVEVVNTGRPFESGNGWTQWNVPWHQWTGDSAT